MKLAHPGAGRALGLAAALFLAAAPERSGAQPRAPSGAEAKIGRATGAPLPRFASLRRIPARVRQGPGADYPILWELTRRNLPVEIFSEHDHWRRVRLHNGETGWIHKALLSTRRTAVMIGSDGVLQENPLPDAPPIARIGEATPLKVLRCQADWCEAEAQNLRGWAEKRRLWGVGPDEIFP